jgi:hypothetical protein
MCPYCISNMALVAAGVVSTGGVTSVIAHKLRQKLSRRFSGRRQQTRNYSDRKELL